MILNAQLYFANKGSLKTFFLHARVIMQNTRGNWTKKNYLEVKLSAYARTSQANILHLDQKAAKCTTCKRLYGKFYTSVTRKPLV